MLKKPLGEGENPLSGRKVRGNKYYEPIVAPLGGSLVNLPGGEIYSALEKGVVDGAAWPVAGQERMRFHEVAKFMMRPRFGTSPFTIAMKLDKFNALSKEDQALLLKAGQDVEASAPKDFDAMAERTVNELKAAGIQGNRARSEAVRQDRFRIEGRCVGHCENDTEHGEACRCIL